MDQYLYFFSIIPCSIPYALNLLQTRSLTNLDCLIRSR